MSLIMLLKFNFAKRQVERVSLKNTRATEDLTNLPGQQTDQHQCYLSFHNRLTYFENNRIGNKDADRTTGMIYSGSWVN